MFENLFKIEENWIVFFDLFSKNGNGDSIRPIAEELRKRRPNMKFFFCDKKHHRLKHIDMADEIITENTLRFKYVCSKAKYIVSPMGFPNGGKKRKGQIFVQTWHGSPIKKLYLSRNKNNRKFRRYAKQFKNTDFFCSQGDYTGKLLQESLNIRDNQMLNSGLPRNDILFNVTEDFRQNLKKQLGLPENKRIVLYCPTWRRYDRKAILPFNLETLKRELGDEYIFLIRSHVGKHKWVDEHNRPVNIFDNEFSFNGGNYPEVTHLYTITDILVSDYSSAIYDFALTQKAQVLYIYDKEEYEKNFGLLVDIENFSPFPKAMNTNELIESIRNYNVSAEDYDKFVNTYLEYEKGTAAKQVVDKILEE